MALPVHYDENSILMDIMKDPKAVKAIQPLIDAMTATLRPNADETTEAAAEAISNDMTMAMMNYMPLRGMLSFGGDQLPPNFLEDMLAKLNG